MNNDTPNNSSAQESPKAASKKPVIIYIMILFIAAFLHRKHFSNPFSRVLNS